MNQVLCLLIFFGLLFPYPSVETDQTSLQVQSQIRWEVTENSKIEDTLSYLTDVSGPRLTGSKGLADASAWTIGKLEEWGLSNARLEPWGEFGRGWELEEFRLELLEPYYMPLIGYPKAWVKSTAGPVAGHPILVEVETESDFEHYKGRLKGAIVLLGPPREVDAGFDPDSVRYSDEDLHLIAQAPVETRRRGDRWRKLREWRKKVLEFFDAEGVAVILEPGRGSDGTVFAGSGGSHRMNEGLGLPSVVMAAEHYGLIYRILQKDRKPVVSISLKGRTYEDDLQGYNILAEIPGADPNLKDEIVILGGHLDSWHLGTGTTDNATGCAVVLETVRILKVLRVQPRRTIRIALWTGEEQGLLGSEGYVRDHYLTETEGVYKADYDKLSAYFNLDNGTGRIRGVYLQGNSAVRPVFAEFMEPLRDLGMSTLTIRNTGGTDHLPFDRIGLPAFQFIQDPVAYDTRTHHSNMDLFENAQIDDLKQSVIVMATFVYNTAMRDEKLPRKVIAKQGEM